MPNYTRYLTPDFVVGELDKIIGEQPGVAEIIKLNSNLMYTALISGMGEVIYPKGTPIEVTVGVRSGDLADEVNKVSREIFDFGRRIGTDLIDDLANNHLSHFDTYPFNEIIFIYVLGYFNPERIEGFRRENRKSENAHLYPPEQNVN